MRYILLFIVLTWMISDLCSSLYVNLLRVKNRSAFDCSPGSKQIKSIKSKGKRYCRSCTCDAKYKWICYKTSGKCQPTEVRNHICVKKGEHPGIQLDRCVRCECEESLLVCSKINTTRCEAHKPGYSRIGF